VHAPRFGMMIDMVDQPQPAPSHPAYPVRTRQLSLRPLTGRDIDALLTYRADAEVCRYLPFEPMTRTDIEQHLASRWAGTWLTDEGQELRLGVELAATGELIGDVVLFWHSREHRGGEIGMCWIPASRGTGTPPRPRVRC
jgi:RimJ/RimL family protein N-acetyltransferase